jgi:type II restriction/modification system DNA methylase subunit YeeA
MNRTKIKNYAPKARREFIQAVKDRAAHFGITEKKTEPVVEKGDGVVIGGKAFPRAVGGKRKKLEALVEQYGFDPAMERLAYTWFNRLVALRFMELHGYLDHGYRVLSHPEGKPTPELLEHAEHVELPGLKQATVIDLKLAGNKEAELYRQLLVAQCNVLHSALPFLFERIDDETELVLPDNLLHSDSIVRKLVNEIDEDDWQEVEIIGWLYEAYVSERYEAVIGKVVAGADIPAATQRFTPKWIVRYLVQNTLGRMWLATYPQSALRDSMKYFIEPAEQTPEVQEQLKAITPTSLNPEELTLLDPACGSGHILVEAYDLFKAIYQERGYPKRDIPALILTKNLFGLEIDDRAAQLAAFALVMKARADSPRLFESKVRPNVVALQETAGLDAEDITGALNEPVAAVELPPSGKLFDDDSDLFSKANVAVEGDLAQADIASLIHLFENAKTFGSLIRIPPKLAERLPHIEERVRLVLKHGEGFNRHYADVLLPVIEQARLLARQYDCVVANPPYMGNKYYAGNLKDFVSAGYKAAKSDLYACFVQRNYSFSLPAGLVGMITLPNWMFHAQLEAFREWIADHFSPVTFADNGRGIFGSDFGSCSFVLQTGTAAKRIGSFQMLFDRRGDVASNDELERRLLSRKPYFRSLDDMARIPGRPLAYWISDNLLRSFTALQPLSEYSIIKHGMSTSDNDKYLRVWHEVAVAMMNLTCHTPAEAKDSGVKWFPFNKGGEYRKWYGNNSYLVNWQNDGEEIKRVSDEKYPYLKGNLDYVLGGQDCFFREGITWSAVTAGGLSMRYFPHGSTFGSTGQSLFTKRNGDLLDQLAYLNSIVATRLLETMCSTLHFNAGTIAVLPFDPVSGEKGKVRASQCVELAIADWNSFETSWDFQTLPLLQSKAVTLQQAQEAADTECDGRFHRMKELEEENNRLFIDAYGLQDELSPEVPDDQITLYRPNREEDIKRLLSYAIGCMMGRYSLDKPGLIYAHAGNEGFDPGQYKTFPADPDGILPLTELDWGFADDPVKRVGEFVSVAWPKEHLAENLQFIEDGLGEPVRKYLATGFYKDHLRWYKRRPIYWLFSSGKQRAFQCLVYLHRYHEGTLARMRTEYVIPLQGRIAARIEQLENEKSNAKSASRRNQIQKEIDKLVKQQAELRGFDERLRHMADQRIKLDLDDGVKVNYAKFGDLLAEVKAVTGGKEEE